MEQLPFLSRQREDGDEREQDDRHRKKHGAADQPGGRQHRLQDTTAIAGVYPLLLHEPEGVLGDHDARIDEYTDCDCDARQAHDVGRDAGVVHPEKRDQYRQRQRNRDDEDGAEMHQKDDVRQRHENDLLEERRAKRAGRLFNQRGPIVERHDCHARGQSRFDLRDPRLDGVDDVLRVHAGSGDDDTAHGLLRAFDQR